MEAISGWLKQIIFVILLATFIDLLMPNKKMERYVKTVIGLFILMTLMTPIFTIFKHSWNPSQLLQQARQLQTNTEIEQEKKMPSLQSIMQKGDQLKSFDQQQSQVLLNNKIADRIKTGLATKLSLQASKIEVQTASDKQGSLYIKTILVTIQSGVNISNSNQPSSSEVKVVKPLKPVQIQVQIPSVQNTKTSKNDTNKSKREETIQQKVIAYITQEWPVTNDQISVHFETNSRG